MSDPAKDRKHGHTPSSDLQTALADLDVKPWTLHARHNDLSTPILVEDGSARCNTSRSVLPDLSNFKLPIHDPFEGSDMSDILDSNLASAYTARSPDQAAGQRELSNNCRQDLGHFTVPRSQSDLQILLSHQDKLNVDNSQPKRAPAGSRDNACCLNADEHINVPSTVEIEDVFDKESRISASEEARLPEQYLGSWRTQQASAKDHTKSLGFSVKQLTAGTWKQQKTTSTTENKTTTGPVKYDACRLGRTTPSRLLGKPAVRSSFLSSAQQERADRIPANTLAHEDPALRLIFEGNIDVASSLKEDSPSSRRTAPSPLKEETKHDGTTRKNDAVEDFPEFHLMREMQDLRGQNLRMSSQCEEYHKTISNLKGDYEESQRQLAELQSRLVTVTRERQAAQVSSQEQKAKIMSLTGAFRTLQSSFSACTQEQNVLKESLVSFSNRIADLKTEIKLHSDKTTSTAGIVQLLATLKQCTSHILQSSKDTLSLGDSLKDNLRDLCGNSLAYSLAERERMSKVLHEAKSLAVLHQRQIESRLTGLETHIDASFERIRHSDQDFGTQAGRYLTDFSRALKLLKSGISSRLIEADERVLGLRIALLVRSQTLRDAQKQIIERDHQMQFLQAESASSSDKLLKYDQITTNTMTTLNEIGTQLLELKIATVPRPPSPTVAKHVPFEISELELKSKQILEELTSMKVVITEQIELLTQLKNEHGQLQTDVEHLQAAQQKDKQGVLISATQNNLDFDFEQNLCMLQMRKVHDQKIMELENKVKSQTSKLGRLESERESTREMHLKATTQLRELITSLEFEKADLLKKLEECRRNEYAANREQRTLQLSENKRLLELQAENDALKHENHQIQGLKSDKISLESTVTALNVKLEGLLRELEGHKMKKPSQALPNNANSLRPAHSGDDVKDLIPTSSLTVIPTCHGPRYPSIQFSREAFGLELELEDDEVVQDTPRRSSNQGSRKEKDKEKKRRSLPEVVRQSQEQPGETFLQPNALAQNSGLVVGRLRAEGSVRSRSSTRQQGYKKRKSN